MASLYGKYIAEREGVSIIEEDFGFVSYAFYDTAAGKRLYVHDMFILLEERRSGKGKLFRDMLIQLAKDNNCTHIMSAVDVTTNKATESLVFQIKMGSKVVGADKNIINLFYKVEY